jgi:hypothetical protein
MPKAVMAAISVSLSLFMILLLSFAASKGGCRDACYWGSVFDAGDLQLVFF